MTLAAGDLFVSGSILSYQQLNRIYQHFRGASAPSSPQAGGIFSDSDDDKLYHYGSAWEEILQLTRSFDVSPQFATLRLMDTGADHYLDVSCEEELTANKLLDIVVGDTNRAMTLSGNPTLADWFDQAVKVASSPTFVAVTLSGGQVVFPASQNASANANTLDDYEEGTWTPDIQFGGAKVGITYTVTSGLYTKIGNKVTVTCHVALSSKGTSVGTAIIEGLPFTIKNSQGAYSGASFRVANTTFANVPQAYTIIASTSITLVEVTEAGTETVLTNADFTNTTDLILQLTYFV